MGTMLIGYDVEWPGDGDVTPQFLIQAQQLHNRLGIPATLFVVGRTLERWIPQFQSIADDPLFDIQQHTYSHQLFKTVCIDDGTSLRVVQGVSPEVTQTEIRKTTHLLREHIGIECIGVTGPYTYYRGLRDRPDILQVLLDEGIRFTRSEGRNAQDWHPVSVDVQPYWYSPFGFPDILEIPVHGWIDNPLRERVLGWADLEGYVATVSTFIDQAAREDKVFSLCQHDWSSIREDPTMSATEGIFRHALDRGMRFLDYRSYYDECKDQREALERSNPSEAGATTLSQSS